MPRKTKAERETEATRISKVLSAKLDEVSEMVSQLNTACSELENSRTLSLLDSVSLGLYEELDKLCKKAPAEAVTDLALEQVNYVIREAKQLVSNDVYVQRLNEFVPAGDRPEHRDVVVVLRQIRQGLERYRDHLKERRERLDGELSRAKTIMRVLEMYLGGKETLTKRNLQQWGISLPDAWFSEDFPYPLAWDVLDGLDIRAYVNGPQ